MSAVHPWEGNEVPHAALQLRMVGVSHRRSSPGLLEQVAVRREDLPSLLETLQSAGYAEAVLLSTCSRTEIYARSGSGSEQGLIEILAAQAGVRGPRWTTV